MSLLAAPSGPDLCGGFALIVGLAFLITFTITRGVIPFWRNLGTKWPPLRADYAASDPWWLRAGTLLFSGAIAAGMVSGPLVGLGMPLGRTVWIFGWFAGIALVRCVVGPRAAGAFSGTALAGLALYGLIRESHPSPAARDEPFVFVLAIAFGVGYGLSALTGGVARLVRGLGYIVGSRIWSCRSGETT